MSAPALARTRLICTSVIVVALLFGQDVEAQEAYPQPAEYYVVDNAEIISQPDEDAIREMFRDLEYQTGIEAVVVTINSVAEYGSAEDTVESLATRLFNEWGVGHKRENNGVLILVAVQDRECRIELGRTYGRPSQSLVQRSVDETMTSYFRAGNYSRGIHESCRSLIENITTEVSWLELHIWKIVVGVPIGLCIAAGISYVHSGEEGWGSAFFAGVGRLLLFWIERSARWSLYRFRGYGSSSSFGGGASGSW